jgi:hypothetical protein
MPLPSDTPDAVERLLIEGYRQMTPAQKLARVVALNRAVEELATARLRATYGASMSEEERRLRLAALRHDAEFMTEAFGWNPHVRGY